MNKLKRLVKGYISIIASIVFAICTTIYFVSIKGLEKPAGLSEAFRFMIEYPKDYWLCLGCGGLAKLAFAMVVVIAIISALCLFNLYLEYKYDYEEIEKIEIIKYITNIILAIVIGIIQKKILLSFWELAITLVIAIFFIKIWMDNS